MVGRALHSISSPPSSVRGLARRSVSRSATMASVSTFRRYFVTATRRAKRSETLRWPRRYASVLERTARPYNCSPMAHRELAPSFVAEFRLDADPRKRAVVQRRLRAAGQGTRLPVRAVGAARPALPAQAHQRWPGRSSPGAVDDRGRHRQRRRFRALLRRAAAPVAAAAPAAATARPAAPAGLASVLRRARPSPPRPLCVVALAAGPDHRGGAGRGAPTQRRAPAKPARQPDQPHPLYGTDIRIERLSYRAWQRGHYSRAVRDRAPGMFVSELRRKAASAGGSVVEFDTGTTALSQVCVCGRRERKSLELRTHRCPCGITAQRDLFSALLARHVHPGTQALDARAAAAELSMRHDIAARTASSNRQNRRLGWRSATRTEASVGAGRPQPAAPAGEAAA